MTLLGMAAGMLLVHTTSGTHPSSLLCQLFSVRLMDRLSRLLATHPAGNTATVWVTFLLLTALHVYANVKAMRSLRLTSLNRPRVDILLESYSKGQVRRHPMSRSLLLTSTYCKAGIPVHATCH